MNAQARPDRVCQILIKVPVQNVWDELTKTGSLQRPLDKRFLEAGFRRPTGPRSRPSSAASAHLHLHDGP